VSTPRSVATALGRATGDDPVLDRIRRGLRMVTVPLPHLSGLAASVQVAIDDRVPTMGVFASGRMVVNREFADRLDDRDLVFVLAHELLHLALRTHDRAKGSDRLEFNYAHDYIINDILRAELGYEAIPAGGLDMPGARAKSAEEIVLDMRRDASRRNPRSGVWSKESGQAAKGPQARAGGARADEQGEGEGEHGDVLDARTERDWFPGEADDQAGAEEAMRQAAARSLALARAMGALKGLRGVAEGGQSQSMEALRGLYRPAWEVAMQRWLESVAPGDRTFSRASRRGADRTDIVLPGRRREGWMLNIVLDTSGSMVETLPRALGAIGSFCDSSGVDEVRLVQCDAAVTADDRVPPEELTRFGIHGFGGSDMGPAMRYLAEDPFVRNVIVLTDGDIAWPDEAMPYRVLWVLTGPRPASFAPSHGEVIAMDPQ